MMTSLAQRLASLQQRIHRAERAAMRAPGSVQLLAVSKTRPAADLLRAYQHGQRHFGESYLQEALDKQLALGHCDISWHFIGPIQSNKTRQIARHFAWVHSVDRLKIATRLSEQRPEQLPPLNICLQVNISGEASKSGISLEQLPQLAADIASLPRLKLRGVMAIPARTDDFEAQRLPYRRLHAAITAQLPALDTFSMGMSGDMEAAIAEGATLIRIGTDLFGPRLPRQDPVSVEPQR